MAQQRSARKDKALGKWGCWRFFHQDASIRPYLPPSAVFNRASLGRFLQQFGEVYVKPNAGGGGHGIIKVWKAERGYRFIRERGSAVSAATVDELYEKVRRACRPGLHMVQKGIRMATVNGRRYDVRLMMMRVNGQWQDVGLMAKVAGPGSVITNIARGKGYALDIDSALRRSLGYGPARIAALKKEMIELGHRTAKRFDHHHRFQQLGLDLAIDQNGKIWMLEENTRPAHSLFVHLKDQSLIRRIRAIAAKQGKAGGSKDKKSVEPVKKAAGNRPLAKNSSDPGVAKQKTKTVAKVGAAGNRSSVQNPSDSHQTQHVTHRGVRQTVSQRVNGQKTQRAVQGWAGKAVNVGKVGSHVKAGSNGQLVNNGNATSSPPLIMRSSARRLAIRVTPRNKRAASVSVKGPVRLSGRQSGPIPKRELRQLVRQTQSAAQVRDLLQLLKKKSPASIGIDDLMKFSTQHSNQQLQDLLTMTGNKPLTQWLDELIQRTMRR